MQHDNWIYCRNSFEVSYCNLSLILYMMTKMVINVSTLDFIIPFRNRSLYSKSKNDRRQRLRQWHTAISRIYHHPFIRIYISHTKYFLRYFLNVSNHCYLRHIIELHISCTVIFTTAGQHYCCTNNDRE